MPPPSRLRRFTSWQHENQVIEDYIRCQPPAGARLEILEAGCGQKWNICLEGLPYSLTGIDLDRAALEVRKTTFDDLDEIIGGDLRTYDFGDRRFDVIFNSYVLEHVDGAESVMDNFVRWLRPGGIVVLRIPDPESVKGFFTRVTPHWFHVFYYRRVLGVKTAGLPGHMPYPTYYDPVVSRSGVHDFCARNRLALVDEYGNGLPVRQGRPGVKAALKAFAWLVSILSLGHLDARHENLLFVLRSQGRGPDGRPDNASENVGSDAANPRPPIGSTVAAD